MTSDTNNPAELVDPLPVEETQKLPDETPPQTMKQRRKSSPRKVCNSGMKHVHTFMSGCSMQWKIWQISFGTAKQLKFSQKRSPSMQYFVLQYQMNHTMR